MMAQGCETAEGSVKAGDLDWTKKAATSGRRKVPPPLTEDPGRRKGRLISIPLAAVDSLVSYVAQACASQAQVVALANAECAQFGQRAAVDAVARVSPRKTGVGVDNGCAGAAGCVVELAHSETSMDARYDLDTSYFLHLHNIYRHNAAMQQVHV